MSVLAATDRVRERALAVDPVKTVLLVLLLPFMLFGWTVRLVGYVIAFAWIAGQEGYRDAGRWLDERERRRKALR